MDEKLLNAHFEFGKNWETFLKNIDEESVQQAMVDIAAFLSPSQVKGRTFVDIGCGSGLSSLAAYRLGASKIYSYDIDPVNIRNAEHIKTLFKVPKDFPWVSDVASIVDAHGLIDFPKADLIYAWGVLHHTGAMWNAIKNTAALVKPNGQLYLMLYRDAKLAGAWKIIKRTYVKSPTVIKFIIRNLFAVIQICGIMAKGKNPFKSIKNYGIKSRGMSWYADITDWIGGYPFEYAEAEDVISFLEPLGFELSKIYPSISPKGWGFWGTGSYQYLFTKKLS
jgi:SAM-dependent methyltransferase